MSFPTSIIPNHPLQNGKKLADHYNDAIYYYRQCALIRNVREDMNEVKTQDQFIATMDHSILVHAKVQRERYSTNTFESQTYTNNGFYSAISNIIKNKLSNDGMPATDLALVSLMTNRSKNGKISFKKIDLKKLLGKDKVGTEQQ